MLGHWEASAPVLRRLELFSRQLLHRTPNFTALGVCTLERPLIASVRIKKIRKKNYLKQHKNDFYRLRLLLLHIW